MCHVSVAERDGRRESFNINTRIARPRNAAAVCCKLLTVNIIVIGQAGKQRQLLLCWAQKSLVRLCLENLASSRRLRRLRYCFCVWHLDQALIRPWMRQAFLPLGMIFAGFLVMKCMRVMSCILLAVCLGSGSRLQLVWTARYYAWPTAAVPRLIVDRLLHFFALFHHETPRFHS